MGSDAASGEKPHGHRSGVETWEGRGLAQETWRVPLPENGWQELESIAGHVRTAGVSPNSLLVDNFDLPRCRAMVGGIRHLLE